MNKAPRYTALAVCLLVVLRLAIGWQLLYEGLWKVQTLSTPNPWSSEGYLKNSVGPLRGFYRNLAGDPDELGWLDYDTVNGRWTEWADRFQSHYGLSEQQAKRFRELLDGRAFRLGNRNVFAEALPEFPDSVDPKKTGVSGSVFWFDADAGRIYTDADKPLNPAELGKLLAKAPGDDPKSVAFRRAVNRLYDRAKKGFGYRRQLAGILKGDPDLHSNEDWQKVGKLDQYRDALARYEQKRESASTDFMRDHVDYTWGEIQALRAELTGPVKALESDLKDDAEALLTVEQHRLGDVPAPWTPLKISDTLTIAGLVILGALLLLGLFTRFAALTAAVMLFGFYMAMPPLPGVPEIPGPEHSLIVNKNLIEVIALLGIAALPTGRWFGLDAVAASVFSRRRKKKAPAASAPGNVKGAAPA